MFKLLKMFNKNKEAIVSENSRNYNYSKRGINLKFTLRTDIKDEMVVFLELMEGARSDIEQQLAELE